MHINVHGYLSWILEKPSGSADPVQSIHTCILIILKRKEVESGVGENESAVFEVFKCGKNAVLISGCRVIWMRISTMSIMMTYIIGEILKIYYKEKILNSIFKNELPVGNIN